MAWRIEFERAAARELDKLGHEAARRILRFLRDRIAPLDDPRSVGVALRGDRFGDFWKYRVGDYRLIAHIDDSTVRILVVRVGHRRDVYR
ncbi:translation repressor RelE [Thalassobaculum fulvum]|uniref:Translation repressor RelE n=1 Tax=Thalassobaculum fulvum TaxID=1633335 RepID=A0A918XRM3_9PROT|nr:type II toxin-antitoxin system RelE/ParE family toxin [Thalassobaculum fulvum]GHD50080.1 translation repressor RelE [Thalassobaculum fulvum]